jgi:hypothetical protein
LFEQWSNPRCFVLMRSWLPLIATASRSRSELDAFVRVGVVADDVAHAEQARYALDLERIQHRDQRLAVAVDVA